MWPGRARSSGFGRRGRWRSSIVVARSAAEMPVVTPLRASMETVKAVPEGAGVLLHHHRDVQLVQALPGQGQADQPPPVAGHEVDRLRRHLLGRDGQVALVLPLLVVDDDDEPPLREVRDRLFDRCQWHPRSLTRSRARRVRPSPAPAGTPERRTPPPRSTYLARTSASRLTARPRGFRAEQGRLLGVGDQGDRELRRRRPPPRSGSPRRRRCSPWAPRSASAPPARRTVAITASPSGARPRDPPHGVDVALHDVPAEAPVRRQGRSRCTPSPSARRPRFVRRSVSGVASTSKLRPRPAPRPSGRRR